MDNVTNKGARSGARSGLYSGLDVDDAIDRLKYASVSKLPRCPNDNSIMILDEFNNWVCLKEVERVRAGS